jgi:hypothetical protein
LSEHVKLLLALVAGIVLDRYLLNRLIALVTGLIHPASKSA